MNRPKILTLASLTRRNLVADNDHRHDEARMVRHRTGQARFCRNRVEIYAHFEPIIASLETFCRYLETFSDLINRCHSHLPARRILIEQHLYVIHIINILLSQNLIGRALHKYRAVL